METLPTGSERARTPKYGKYLIQDRGIHYAPRIGLTYDITGHQDMILRAGGGIFYDRYEGNIAFDQIVNPPKSITPRITWGRLQDVDPSNALLAPFGLNAMNYAGEVPTTYNFNLGVQKKLPSSLIWDVAYVGSIQNHLPRRVNANAVPYGAAFAATNQDPTLAAEHDRRSDIASCQLPATISRLRQHQLPPVRRQCELSRVADAARSPFFEWPVRQRQLHVQQGARYTVDVTSTSLASTSFDKQANYGPRQLRPAPHLQLNWVYRLPRMKSAGHLMNGVVNDWQLSGGYRWESGAPYGIGWSVSGMNTQNVTGSFTEGARVVILNDAGQGHSSDPYQQIRTDVFAPPQVGSLGLESGRNYLNRAPINNLDVSLQKTFPVPGKSRGMRIRLDAFNALNHTQFNDVASTIQFRSLTDRTPVNLPYDDQGRLVRTNGFGAVTSYHRPGCCRCSCGLISRQEDSRSPIPLISARFTG